MTHSNAPNPAEKDTKTTTDDPFSWVREEVERDEAIKSGIAAFFRGDAQLTVIPWTAHLGPSGTPVPAYMVTFVRHSK
jgi:hypothetical protein